MKRQAERLLLFGILLVATVCIWAVGSRLKMPDIAEAIPQEGYQGRVLVVPLQIDRDSYGIAMVDTTLQNLWIYKVDGRAPAYNRLRLLAARSWEYDKLLEEYNTAEPKPQQVKELLERLSGANSFESYQDREQSRRNNEYEELMNAGASEGTEAK
jgi:hypothetical protein